MYSWGITFLFCAFVASSLAAIINPIADDIINAVKLEIRNKHLLNYTIENVHIPTKGKCQSLTISGFDTFHRAGNASLTVIGNNSYIDIPLALDTIHIDSTCG